jgi:hypothetical protein
MKSLEEIANITIDRCWLIIEEYSQELDLLPPEDSTFIWGTAELFGGYLLNMIQGRCSLAESIEFDLNDCVMTRLRDVKTIWKKCRALRSG